jgi:hypothetical protein
MMMQLPRISRKYLHIAVTSILYDGSPATVSGVDVAFLPSYATPTENTVWTATDYADGDAVILVAGPDASVEGALTVPPEGAQLWARVTDSPEIDAVQVGRIEIV